MKVPILSQTVQMDPRGKWEKKLHGREKETKIDSKINPKLMQSQRQCSHGGKQYVGSLKNQKSTKTTISSRNSTLGYKCKNKQKKT